MYLCARSGHKKVSRSISLNVNQKTEIVCISLYGIVSKVILLSFLSDPADGTGDNGVGSQWFQTSSSTVTPVIWAIISTSSRLLPTQSV